DPPSPTPTTPVATPTQPTVTPTSPTVTQTKPSISLVSPSDPGNLIVDQGQPYPFTVSAHATTQGATIDHVYCSVDAPGQPRRGVAAINTSDPGTSNYTCSTDMKSSIGEYPPANTK